MRHTIAVWVENEFGVLTRVAGHDPELDVAFGDPVHRSGLPARLARALLRCCRQRPEAAQRQENSHGTERTTLDGRAETM